MCRLRGPAAGAATSSAACALCLLRPISSSHVCSLQVLLSALGLSREQEDVVLNARRLLLEELMAVAEEWRAILPLLALELLKVQMARSMPALMS